MNEIQKDLKNANELKFKGNYRESLEIYDKHFKLNPEAFKYKDRNDYAWTIYKVHVQNFKKGNDLYRYCELITQLVPQKDLNTDKNCIYTLAVFKVLKQLDKDKDYYTMLSWLEKINPDMLDDKQYRQYGKIQKSKKELFYDYASKAYYNTGEFEKCIEVSGLALDTINRFIHDGDTWHKWRLANSLKELNRCGEALPYLLEVIEVKHDWYMYRDIAEVYYRLNNPLKALKYCCPVVLSNVSDKIKINIYYLIYNILKGFNHEQALKHAQYFYLLKKESGYRIPYDIENLNFDDVYLDKNQLKGEIIDIWTLYKFQNKKLHYGNIIKFFEDKNYGFIKTDDNKTLFFHKSEFRDHSIEVGQNVSFYTEKRFDKSKNRESLNAVNIKIRC